MDASQCKFKFVLPGHGGANGAPVMFSRTDINPTRRSTWFGEGVRGEPMRIDESYGPSTGIFDSGPMVERDYVGAPD